MSKPRICEVLGVEVDQEFSIDFPEEYPHSKDDIFKIDEEGNILIKTPIDSSFYKSLSPFPLIINNPSLIKKKYPIEFTKDEKAVLRSLRNAGFTSMIVSRVDSDQVSDEYIAELYDYADNDRSLSRNNIIPCLLPTIIESWDKFDKRFDTVRFIFSQMDLDD